MQIFSVGGSVRDELLGRPNVDRDYVVVGSTPEEMISLGFRPVGKDFPVFLHPETQEEYALARTERKSGRGYHGFQFSTDPKVTLEEDLGRRDLTINAMARSAGGELTDPYGGYADLRSGVLRHVSPAFAEDPLRVLRIARFAARFGFSVAPETEALLRDIVASGELDTLPAERLWQELSRGLMEPRPSLMLMVLRNCGALSALLPEVDELFGVPQPVQHHPEIDTGVHLLQALDYCARKDYSLPVRYAVLLHDLGKGTTSEENLPRHIAHEARSAKLAERVNHRLKVPADCKELAVLTARLHGNVHRARELKPQTLLDLIQSVDALRRPYRLEQLLQACEADAQSRPGKEGRYPPYDWMMAALAIVRQVDAAAIAAGAKEPAAINAALRAERVKALKQWKAAKEDQHSNPA